MTKLKTSIRVTADFRGFHRWKDAPDEVEFLRSWHRHLFKVQVDFAVGHGNRELEFFIMQGRLRVILSSWEGRQFEESCEQIAARILGVFIGDGFAAVCCSVSEDGENAGYAYIDEEPKADPPSVDELVDKNVQIEASQVDKLVWETDLDPAWCDLSQDDLLALQQLDDELTQVINKARSVRPKSKSTVGNRQLSHRVLALLLKHAPWQALSRAREALISIPS